MRFSTEGENPRGWKYLGATLAARNPLCILAGRDSIVLVFSSRRYPCSRYSAVVSVAHLDNISRYFASSSSNASSPEHTDRRPAFPCYFTADKTKREITGQEPTARCGCALEIFPIENLAAYILSRHVFSIGPFFPLHNTSVHGALTFPRDSRRPRDF